ncbi:hypothetical protein L5515_013760 [Caenorhabditis briggsae]|uniref:Uncharacterized protein n=1 Tax=Caenorhabditis briggsae TaxID=6238 RepID=A0AAE9ITH6_CAEBR|nr:hypothetical protein L3Y34_017624 [Caenorhabditis briggsae]UMM16974.1 hypothetical protein L5515_013760 [Caenorhabditis briggsae]
MLGINLIFKVFGLFLAVAGQQPAPNNGEILMPTDEPFNMLKGEYQLDVNEMSNYRPTWASVWKITQNDVNNEIFYISTWPPKYCHGIYICPLIKQDYHDTNNFKTVEPEMCEKEYIKFYPHINKLHVKVAGGAEEEKYWMKNRLGFSIDNQFKAKLHVLESKPESHEQFMNATQKFIDFDFKNKEFLILTNSRMCQVNKIGSQFYPFFRKGIQKNPDQFPMWLNHGGQSNVATDYLPPVKSTSRGKKIDLLEYLKEQTWTSKKLGNLVKACEPVVGWRASGRKKPVNAQFKKVSVSSYAVNLPSATYKTDTVRRFTLNVEKCHWFRIWMTPKGEMTEYNTEMKLSETVDFFLNEGFYISPESDEAHPLPGVNELTKFTFTAALKDDVDLVDMTYGEMQGSPIYHDQFKLSAVGKTAFNLHIIKAPGCEISLDSRPALWTDFDAARVNNALHFGTCKFSFFQ